MAYAENQVTLEVVSDGSDGVGVSSIQPQYYLSTSSSSATGGSWSNTLTYESGKYIWTRDEVTLSNGTVTHSTAIYNQALTNANEKSESAITLAEGTNEHFWNDNTGAHVTQITQDEWNDSSSPNYHSGGNTLITSEGMAIRDGVTELAVFGASGAQIGQADSSNISLNPSGVSGTGADGAPYFDFNGTSAEITYTIRKELPAARFDAQTLSTRTQVIDAVYDISDFADVGEVCSFEAFYVRFNTEDRILSYSSPVNCTVQNMNSVKVTPGSSTIGTDLTINASVTLHLGISSVTHKLFEEVSFAYSGTDNTISVSVYATITQGGSYNVSGGYANMRYITRQDTVSAPCMTFGTRAGDDDPGGLSSTFGGFLYGTGEYQTALGKFNEQDTNDEYSLIIGNGTADNARSNALTVGWNGNVTASGNITDGSGNTLSTIASATNSKLKNITVKGISKSFYIGAGTSTSATTKDISFTSTELEGGSIYNAYVCLGTYQLPYFNVANKLFTWISSITSNTITISNSATAWGSSSSPYTAYCVLFLTGTT